MTDNELQQRLFDATIKNIRRCWKNKTGLAQFIAVAQDELRLIQDNYMVETTKLTAQKLKECLSEAAQKLQLSIDTEIQLVRHGIQISIMNQGSRYGEIFIGPRDAWDKIMYLPPTGELYFTHQENPYTKRRIRQWKNIEDFDFDGFMNIVKEAIDRPSPEEEFDDDDEIPF